jgi:hypothetical protein
MMSRANLKNVNDRLRRVEQKYAKHQQRPCDRTKNIESRLMRGAVAGLNANELEDFIALMKALRTDLETKPSPQQQTAFEAYGIIMTS